MTTALVDQCRNVFGTLSDDCRRRLEAVIDNPSQATWDAAYSIIIDGNFGTLWQAWCQIDVAAPRSKPHDAEWPVIPDSFTIYRAIHHAHKHGIRPGLS